MLTKLAGVVYHGGHPAYPAQAASHTCTTRQEPTAQGVAGGGPCYVPPPPDYDSPGGMCVIYCTGPTGHIGGDASDDGCIRVCVP